MESIVQELIELGFIVVTLFVTYHFVSAFLKKPKKSSLILQSAVILTVISLQFITVQASTTGLLISIMSILGIFFIARICFDTTIPSASIAAFFSFLAGSSSELLSTFIVTALQERPVHYMLELSVYRFQARTLSILILIVIVILVRHFRVGQFGVMTFKVILTLSLLPIASILFIQYFVINIIAENNAPTMGDITPIFNIIVVNIFLFVMIENIIRQSENNHKLILMETQNLAQQKHIEQLVNNREQVRRMSHDFKQQVQIIHMMCANNQHSELLEYVGSLSSNTIGNLIVETNNTMLDSILTSKLEEAEKHSITVSKIFDVAPSLEYINMDMCVMLGNALDNAIEACLRTDQDRFIGIEIIATSSQFLCHIKNSVGEMPLTDGVLLKTAKPDVLYHGIGVQSMTQTCQDLGGDLSYSFDENHFNLWIALSFGDLKRLNLKEND